MTKDAGTARPPTREGDESGAPRFAHTALNRCNVPPHIIAAQAFQKHPLAIEIDGVRTFHGDLFRRLDRLTTPDARARAFADYMTVAFRLHRPQDVGGGDARKRGREGATYLNILRGWGFDPDGREGAVLKRWAESRFGLCTLYHDGPLSKGPDKAGGDDEASPYQSATSRGLYNTNALEAQLDLVYAFCQDELARRPGTGAHIDLYRGVNRIDDYAILDRPINPGTGPRRAVMVLNNVNSFTRARARAGEFGDVILKVRVPLVKIFFFPGLLPGRLDGEGEHIVIGGVYAVEYSTF
ncbi:NAD(+)--dinitrogen-reductase ADP-D-ribosyltransferase [Varunaivibrio sulfuroxidans]|uniref:NAD+--dinitrogen-reductase ADP-D-ribosyltransferase n=1 Tax=Varunaivibrio sulfuroxidans TaxID=1773489 RepID=A0A4R3JAQ9_9PROT|nr:NAD(+)--dinitrogen-reductase ADP-D-ribosyltransferase [Varunaivibrio sulfuroxidans]TCS61740.1 NAD+--dinitrogen-reductase ADP-D-ribosyltransferase [Varunaivibrio sulfuroxidans]WES32075.1 NAD(+)--dinitrogen-reductase ADP-D-ribosyltransferase [Varunaivibrio sulfuroxidans]